MDDSSSPPSLSGLRLLAVSNGLLYAVPVGLAALFGVSVLAESLGHATGMETTVIAIAATIVAAGSGTIAGVASALRHSTADGLARALGRLWSWQAIGLPVIVLLATGAQLAMKPLPA